MKSVLDKIANNNVLAKYVAQKPKAAKAKDPNTATDENKKRFFIDFIYEPKNEICQKI